MGALETYVACIETDGDAGPLFDLLRHVGDVVGEVRKVDETAGSIADVASGANPVVGLANFLAWRNVTWTKLTT